MSQFNAVNIQEENELQKIAEQVKRNYLLFIIGISIALLIAFLNNHFSLPVYKVSTSILIKESKEQQNMGNFITENLFGSNKNLQNELLLLQSAPVLFQTVKNLDLPVSYFRKTNFQYFEAYKSAPFKVLYQHSHVQPIGVRFNILLGANESFTISAKEEEVLFYNYEQETFIAKKKNWTFQQKGKFGQLIETNDLSFIIQKDSTTDFQKEKELNWYFEFSSIQNLVEGLRNRLEFNIIDIDATAIEISMKSNSPEKGIDILNQISDVYSNQNLEKKNHLAGITIAYIDKQLGEISDSLSKTEQTLQNFRSSNQLLNVSEQASGITVQRRELENSKAEQLTKKRYYEYVLDYLTKNDNLAKIIVPASLGIQDNLLNTLMGELITAEAQKNNLIENNQEKNPLVKKLNIQIENLKRTISENITYVLKTIDISLDELNKRISKIEAEISRIPKTERQLTGIERKFRLSDAIYNYLMEKRAEANINKASNLPDNEVIEPAKIVGGGPVSPNGRTNYMIAFVLGIIIPLGYLQLKNVFNQRIESQEQIEKITDIPVLGKILHSNRKTNNVVFEYPNSSIAEAYRALRTNLDYYSRGGHKKVIMVTSSTEGEGKSFSALNLAMCYAQFNRKTIIVDFDLRKPNNYFKEGGDNLIGLSSYLINKAVLEDIIIKSPNNKLDYIPSGPIPPNPVELIGLEQTERLINILKDQYEYVIIDTPPLAQVTDAYLLMEQSDIKIIVTRYNHTIKKAFSYVMKDLKQKNIKNICILYNDNRYYNEQYGYGYGYNNKKDKLI